jgi:hypothetical protein
MEWYKAQSGAATAATRRIRARSPAPVLIRSFANRKKTARLTNLGK